MKCPYCKGEGETMAFHVLMSSGRSEFCKVLPCPDCGGTGEVHDNYPEWIKRGQKLKRQRLQDHMTLRKGAAHLGLSAYDLSRMERGLVEPVEWKREAEL